MKRSIIENIVRRVTKKVLNERKSDELSLNLSRLVVNQFKKKENFLFDNIYFERGDEYASFDLECNFFKDEDLDEPFSIDASADMQEMEINITYNPNSFPESMSDLVAEIKETIEHELEHIEQQNFEDMYIGDEEEYDEEDEEYNFKYLTSKTEIPAYVRGLIKRSKVKKITLDDAMDEWYSENKKKFTDGEKEWKKVKRLWLDYANEMRIKNKIKKFQ
jgi:hypothetical protein